MVTPNGKSAIANFPVYSKVLTILVTDYTSLTNQISPLLPSLACGAIVLTYFSDPPQKFPNVATCPTVGTDVLEVSDVVIAAPEAFTEPNVAVVTFMLPAPVVFKTFCLLATIQVLLIESLCRMLEVTLMSL